MGNHGRILADLGQFSNEEGDESPRSLEPESRFDDIILVVMRNPADFVGGALGGSDKNAKAMLDASVGKVLVIDEASVKYRPPTPLTPLLGIRQWES